MTIGMAADARTASTCSMVPAVMLESAQHASLRVCIFAPVSAPPSLLTKPASTTACVASFEPVTTLHSARSAGVTSLTPFSSWAMREMTQPCSITRSIESLCPSVTYESAQHTSMSNSSSASVSRRASIGTACATCVIDGCGLPRTKLERAHVALRSGTMWPAVAVASISASTRSIPPCERTRSRRRGQSPAMLPSAQTACSETAMCGEPRSVTRAGTASCFTTTSHCAAVPDAMFVRHHAASNCSWSFGCASIVTNAGQRPWLITSSMGGQLGMESSLRSARTAPSASSSSSACPLRATKPSALVA
mmetsp:Transcript_16699/g.43914  ORF Transcript_16699/g.43914 Transcript_16699/m.43914 type:complete len:307 (+) Transcript_16699:993-1913(+)